MHNDSATTSNPNIKANITGTDICECKNCRYKSIGFICRHGTGRCMKTDVKAMQNRRNITTIETEEQDDIQQKLNTKPKGAIS